MPPPPPSSPSRGPILAATLASAWLSGSLSGLSLFTIPALSPSPSSSISPSTSTIQSQFKTLSRLTHLTHPPTTLVTSLIYLFAAYQAYYLAKVRDGRRLIIPTLALTGAGGALLGVLGFTWAVVAPTGRALTEMLHYHDIERNDGRDETALLRRWGRLNGVRAALAGVATGLGAWVLMMS